MDASGTPAEVAPFCMDVTEVTYGAYRKCAEAGRCAPADATVTRLTTDSDDAWRNFCSVCNANYLDHDEHPLNCVDWIQAHAYCAWLGRRLPTTEEWEWAARGAERGTTFPWGNDPPGSRPCWSGIIPQAGTCPANAHPEGANQFGVRDLAGNLVEWTATEGPLFGDEPSKVARGGSWFDTAWEKMSPAAKLSQRVSQRTNTVGFRCVK